MIILPRKQTEFVILFQDFISSYPYTNAGLNHIKSYNEQRQQGCRNFKAIANAAKSGEDVTESILLQLLPYDKSGNNDQSGAWIHIAPAVTKDLKKLFETDEFTKSKDLQQMALLILDFVSRCNEYPRELFSACTEFSQLPYSKHFQAGILTPILNALRPSDFLLLNNKSIKVINYFANTAYTQKIIDYPVGNFIGHKIIQELAYHMKQPGVPALRESDLFDMFSHWLVAVKVHNCISQNMPPDEYIEDVSEFKYVELQPAYTLSECAEDTGFDQTELERWIRAINRKKQAIIYGSPGTGKTFIAERLTKHLIGNGDGFSELVQFHPAYSYEDFIQGIRPQSEDGKLTYPLVPGRFLEFCKKAEACKDICLLIIDEINRANFAQVFGELMYLLEYRDKKIPLAGGNIFHIPENVRIIGTMNTADRSIALIDHALRRRFAFIELCPNYEVLRRKYKETGFPVEKLIKTLQQLNQAIADKKYEIGISFFLTNNIESDIEDIWRMEIEPYLEEYFNQPETVDAFRWDKVKHQLSL